MRHRLLSLVLSLHAGMMVGCATTAPPVRSVVAPTPLPVVVESKSITSPPSADSPNANVVRLRIEVTDDGFVPKSMTVPRGRPVTFVLRRTTKKKCLHDVIIYLADGIEIRQHLPFNEPAEFTVSFPNAGERGLSCGMKMYGATIQVQ